MKKIVFLILVFLSLPVLGATYSLPSSLGSGIFSSCSGSGTNYTCSASLTLGEEDILNLTQDLNLTINGNFTVREDSRINSNGFTFNITASGDIRVNSDSNIEANLNAGGDIRIDEDGVVNGNLTAGDDIRIDEDGVVTGDLSAGDDIDIREDVTVNGDVTAGDNLTIRNNATVNGVCSPSHPQCTGISSGGSLVCETFLDQFSSTSYSRQDGTVNWASNWSEEGDDNSAASGKILISGGLLQVTGLEWWERLWLWWTTFGGPHIEREADLSAYTSATLSFDYSETGNWGNNDDFEVHISNDGGGSWTLLQRFSDDQTPGSFNADISAYMGADTRIAFAEGADGSDLVFQVDNVQIEACIEATATPLIEYRMDEASWSNVAGEVIDNQQSLNATPVNGAATDTTTPAIAGTPGTCGYGVFDGSDDYVDVAGLTNLTGSFTVTAWIYADQNDGDRRIFADDQNNNGGFGFSLGDGGDGRLRFFSRSVSPVDVDTQASVINTGQWYHVAAVHNASSRTRQIFVNGTAVSLSTGGTSSTYTGTWGSDSGAASIGGENNAANSGEASSNYRFDGNIDEFRLYESALTAGQITDIMNETHPCINLPVAEYRLDENSWSGVAGEVIDSSGNGLDGQAVLGATPVPARVCNGASLNGSSYLRVADNPLLDIDDELTVTAWVQPSLIPSSGLKTIVSKDENFEFHINSAGQIYWWWQWATLTTTGTPLTAGNWYHIAIVYSDAADLQEIYIDGVLRASSNRSGALTLNSDPLDIGGDQGYGGREFEGLIDEVRVYNGALSSVQINAVMNLTRTCAVSGPDHYVIEHSGNGITCEAETITVSAHSSAHGLVAPGNSTTITLTTSLPNDGWSLVSGNGSFNGTDQYTFDGSETTVQFGLRRMTAVTGMDIDVSDGSVSDLDDGGTEDPPLDFADTGLRFYADTVHNTIGPQIAGKSSSIAPGNQALTLRAIQTNTDTMACEARVTGQQTVRMAFECTNPTVCETANGVTLIDSVLGGPGDTLTDNPQGGPINYSDVDLTFDASGTATWTMTYADAGQIQLHAELALAASDPDPAITLSGSSNTFVTSPAGFCVESTDANAGCGGGAGISCPAFQAAGSNFNLTIRAVDWENALEANTDFCTGNSTTPNFQLASIPLNLSLISPSGGTTGSLGATSFSIADADNGGHTITNQTVSEVGIFQIATSDVTYQGQTISASSSDDIGRFYPAHFALTGGAITNRTDLPISGGVFTYMDEDFDVGYTLTAYNAASPAARTENYEGSFAQLDSATELNYAAVDTVASTLLTSRLNTTAAPTITWNNGVLDMSDTLSLSRSASPDGPFNQMSVGIDPTDEDGVILDSYDLDALMADGTNDRGLIDSTEIRYGRMRLQNVFGSELVSLTMPMQAEYFDGTSFVQNTDDDHTPLAVTDLILSNDVETGQVDGDIQVLAGQTSQIDAGVFNNPLSAGDANLVFCPPGNPACTPTAGNSGYIDVILNLSAYPYLQYDWDTLLAGDENPQGRASFGIYDGNSRQIYYRRIYQ